MGASSRPRKALTALWRLASALIKLSPGKAVTSVGVTLGLSLTEGIGLLLLIPLLTLIGVDSERGLTDNVSEFFERVFNFAGIEPTLAVILLIYVGIMSVQILLRRWQMSLTAAVQRDVSAILRERLYRAMAHAEWTFLVKSRAADDTHVLVVETGRVGGAARHLMDLTVTLVISIIYFALAFRLAPEMAGIMVGAGVILGWGGRRLIREARVAGRRMSQAKSRMHAALAEHLGSMKTARSYGAVDRQLDAFRHLSDDVREVGRVATRSQTALQQHWSLGQTLLLAGIVYLSQEILRVPTSELLVLLFLFARLMPRLSAVATSAQSIAHAWPAFDIVTDLERRCRAAQERESRHHVRLEPKARIDLDGVTFSYEGTGSPPALSEVTLTIPIGATTAIVGPSGSGKSTLVDILIGLLPPAAGRVLVDGEPLGPEHRDAWLAQIGYVSQDTFLFHDTIAANLRWARPGATDAELWQALRLSSAEEFVLRMPAGLRTMVGDRGVLLSAGERQRLSLARALLRRPSILILDEATSSLDSENELRIQRAIDELHRTLTIVVITHRLSTIRGADVIHVLDRGRGVESGTWSSLMGRDESRFRELWLAQGLERTAADAAMAVPAQRVAARHLWVPPAAGTGVQ